MVNRRTLSLILAVSLVFAPLAWADGTARKSERRVPVQVLKFQFQDENGKVANFNVNDGGTIQITNAQSGLFYRFSAKLQKDGKAEVRLIQYGEAERLSVLAEDQLVFQPGDDFQANSLAPFQIKMTGSMTQMAKLVPVGDVNSAIGCCIGCGGWGLCCEVAVYEPGWMACCYIEMCGWGCEVCEAMYEV